MVRVLIDGAHPRYLQRLLRRAFFLWLVARLVVTALVALAGEPGDRSLALSPMAIMIFTAALAGLAQLDARAMREPLFHANLGTPRVLPALLTAVLVLLLELMIAVVAGVTA